MILYATDAWFILCTNKRYTYVLKKSCNIFPIMKDSVNALMKLAGFSTSNKVKNYRSSVIVIVKPRLLFYRTVGTGGGGVGGHMHHV